MLSASSLANLDNIIVRKLAKNKYNVHRLSSSSGLLSLIISLTGTASSDQIGICGGLNQWKLVGAEIQKWANLTTGCLFLVLFVIFICSVREIRLFGAFCIASLPQKTGVLSAKC